MKNSTFTETKFTETKMSLKPEINIDAKTKNRFKRIDVISKDRSQHVGIKKLLDIEKLSDKELIGLCENFGKNVLHWKRKFIGLIPEVNRRKLYEKKRFSSIYEFGARLAGISYMQVRRVITVDKKLEENGLIELREKLTNGEVSINKLARIVSVVNEENESDLVKAVEKLSQSAVETLVRDEKKYQMENLLGRENESFDDGSLFGDVVSTITGLPHFSTDLLNSSTDLPHSSTGLLNPSTDLPHFSTDLLNPSKHGDDMFVCAHKGGYATDSNVAQPTDAIQQTDAMRSTDATHISVGQSADVSDVSMAGLQSLQKLKLNKSVIARLDELKSNGMDLNLILNEMLDKREKEIEEELDEVGEEVVRKEIKKNGKQVDGKEIGRNIPVNVKRVLKKRAGSKCEVRGCMRDAKTIHHTIRFGIQRSHDPRHLVLLCKEHHEITHVMDKKYLAKR